MNLEVKCLFYWQAYNVAQNMLRVETEQEVPFGDHQGDAPLFPPRTDAAASSEPAGHFTYMLGDVGGVKL